MSEMEPIPDMPSEPAAPQRIKLPPGSVRSAVDGPRMLPGMAMIAIFMLFVALANAVQSMRVAGRLSARLAVLTVSTMIVIGVFGFLRLRRWGWALLTGGTFFYSLGNVVLFAQSRQLGYLMPAAFALVFFLYLVRTEIRERVH